MCTDIEHTIIQLENEINDLIGLAESPRALSPNSVSTNSHCCKQHTEFFSTCLSSLSKFENDFLSSTKRAKTATSKEKKILKNSTIPHLKTKLIEDSPNLLSMEKSSSCPCPERTYCPKKVFGGKPIMKRSVIPFKSFEPKSRSAPCPCDDVVDKLKADITKVRSQLHMMKSDQNKATRKGFEELAKEVRILKEENFKLKENLRTKRKEHQTALSDFKKVKELLSVYEEKVGLLHDKALVSSRVMNASKEKFAKCLDEKERRIKKLVETTKELKISLKDKEKLFLQLDAKYNELEESYRDSSGIDELVKSNEQYCECIKDLENKLLNSENESETYKKELLNIEQKMENLQNSLCEGDRRCEKYVEQLNLIQKNETKLKEEIEFLTKRIKEIEHEKLERELTCECELKHLQKDYEKLQNKCNEMLDKYEDYDRVSERCQYLEEQCETIFNDVQFKEKHFEDERSELKKLVDQLNNVVEQNKATLVHLSDVNKQQENLLKTQTAVLATKDEKIKLVESEYEMMRKKSLELEKEVEELKKTISGPCKNAACESLSSKIKELTEQLSIECDNKLLKEKVIQDQTKTIETLQNKINSHLKELKKLDEMTELSEAECYNLNEKLKNTQCLLETEKIEKQVLINKLKKLEMQKDKLINQMTELEEWIKENQQNYAVMAKEKKEKLEEQLICQKQQWEREKFLLNQERIKAEAAAKFATQKLMETVSDFQKQVNAQKIVQKLLTGILQEKHEKLRAVASKISSLNDITYTVQEDVDLPMQQLFKKASCCCYLKSNTNTSLSTYSTCSEETPKTLDANMAEYMELFKNLSVL